MSKEFAQTVGTKKMGILLTLLAALAVVATLGSQWQKSSAVVPSGTYTISQTPNTGTLNIGDNITYVLTGTGINGASAGAPVATIDLPATLTNVSTACVTNALTATVAASGAGTDPATCTWNAAWGAAGGSFTMTVVAKVASGTTTGVPTVSLVDGSAATIANDVSAPASVAIAGTTGSAGVTAVGTASTVTFTLPPGITYCSDAGATAAPRAGVAGDITVGGGATLVSNTFTTALNNAVGTHTTVINGAVGGTATISTHVVGNTAGTACTPTVVTLASGNFTTAFLRHMGGANNEVVLGIQDVFNNVRGSRHVVCATNGDDVTPVGVIIPLTQANQIAIQTGGGYNAIGDQTPTFSDPQFFVGTGGGPGLAGATCFSWVSTGAGDQQIVATYPNAVAGGVVTVNFGGSAINGSLVKEWNVLESSTVTGATATSGVGTATVTYGISRTLTLNPSTGLHGFTSVGLTDQFTGSHTTSAGGHTTAGGASTLGTNLAGVAWTVALAPGSCGVLSGATSGTTYNTLSGTTLVVAGGPNVSLGAGSSAATDCTVGRTATVVFTGVESGPLASGPGNTVTETVVITFNQSVPIKQVLLAWAGQRVVLEHDWRLTPGDSDNGSGGTGGLGACPFDTETAITYVKGAEGPGNFVAALNAQLNGADQATINLQQSNGDFAGNSQSADFPDSPQGACISRVVYESEDQGEVDVEAFPADVTNGGVGKVAFVIYYMKLNQVQLSLVTQVAKPTHNISNSGLPYYYADYAPGNPWDASKDATGGSADWNVSKDILVRGRVTGWFTNSNPSGRARDDSNKQNVLPADRWVMPDDWANIAGGAALASTFRPSYDLMFAPNNAAGFALALPYSTSSLTANQIASVAATSTGKGNGFGTPITNLPIVVTTKAFMAVGQTIVVGSTSTVICAISPTSNSITVAPAVGGTCNAYPGTATGLVTAPAAGTPIFAALSGVPFVGPYSLIDVPGFAGLPGPAGAAPNNNGGQMPATVSLWRDTTQGDGLVDWWDAPMPPAETSVSLRGTGFIKQVLKEAVYYNGTPVTAAVASGGTQYYPNPYYYQNIPSSPWLPAVASGGGFIWDSWGADGPNVTGCALGANPCAGGNGPYHFWQPAIVGTNSYGVGDSTVSSVNKTELAAIQVAYGDTSIARDLVVYSDNHGEFMVTANGDFKTDLTACATNVLAGGKQCKPGDKVGVGTISAVADYPDFVKHFPVASNAVTVNWTWGGYKDVTIEKGETDQYSYVVFHAMDRDGHCYNSDGATLLHPVLTTLDATSLGQGTATNGVYSHYPTPNQLETVDFLIDSGSGIILSNSGLPYPGTAIAGTNILPSGERGNLIGVPTYSVAQETAYSTGKKTFPVSALAASGQTDECQAWIKVSNSLLGVTNVLAIAHDDEGNIGFDKVVDFQSTMSYTLNFRWSLITWNGADNIPVADALKGGASTKNPAGNDISASVTAVYGWDQAAQQWLAFFPTGVNVPGANNLTALKDGSAYWVAITGPGSVTWTVSTNVS